MEWIRDTDFNVKVIGLTRNPLAVLYSAYRLFHTDPVKRQFDWLRIQQNMHKIKTVLKKEQFMDLKYEDIIANPNKIFDDIFTFIGLSTKYKFKNEVHVKSLMQWQNDPFFTLQLDRNVKEFAVSLGYGNDELHNPEKRKPSLLSLWLRIINNKYRLTRARISYRYVKPFKLRLQQKIKN
jgi:hypothetical protein